MTRGFVLMLTLSLMAFAAAPVGVLVVAAGLPEARVRPYGIAANALADWRGPDLGRILGEGAGDLWWSLVRTLAVSCGAAAFASTAALVSAYLITRRKAPRARLAVSALGVAAYALPSVFLMLAYDGPTHRLHAPDLVKVAFLHVLYLLPMSAILSLTYAATHARALDRSAAIEGASWPRRMMLAYGAGLWRAHLGVFCIGALVSWSDIIFSQQMLREDAKLIVDLYLLRYFDHSSTFPDYLGAAVFGLVVTSLALVLSWLVAVANRR